MLLFGIAICYGVEEREFVVRTTNLDGTAEYAVMSESAYRAHVLQIGKQNDVLGEQYRELLAEEQQRVRDLRQKDRAQGGKNANQKQPAARTQVQIGLKGIPPRRSVRVCGGVGAPDDAATIIAKFSRMEAQGLSVPSSDPALLQELQKRIELAAGREKKITSIDKSGNSLVSDGFTQGTGGLGGQKQGGLGSSSWEMKRICRARYARLAAVCVERLGLFFGWSMDLPHTVRSYSNEYCRVSLCDATTIGAGIRLRLGLR